MAEKNKNRLLAAYDLLAINLSLYIAFALRFEGIIPRPYRDNLTALAIIYTISYMLPLVIFGAYRRIWRYASLRETVLLSLAIVLGTTASNTVVLFVDRTLLLPRSIIALQFLIAGISIAGMRILIRVNLIGRIRSHFVQEIKKHVVVIGAGDAGALLLREINKHTELGIKVHGILDDDDSKQDKNIYGVRVIGTTKDLPSILKERRIDEVIIAMPSAPGTVIRRIMNICNKAQVKTTTLPAIFELVSGNVSINHLRSVKLEDLLKREPVRIANDEIAQYLTGKRVLVTGGAGSIGSEICRQVAKFHPAFIAVFEHCENSLYRLELEMKKKHPDVTFLPVMGSIQDAARVDQVFGSLRPQVIFHAAAHKHVPMMEYNPCEAVKNNVFGTRTVAKTADKYQAARFVLISTDKAVNPTNVMGATKRAAEMVMQDMDKHSQTRFMAVRFGNVLGSDGSVVPLFRKQIQEGGPVTVTHPDVTRYFMTIPEACQLVLQAGALGEGGEVMLLDMGEPTKIKDLAEDLIRFSGLEPGRDIEIEYIGLRPGEKLFEELLLDEENTSATRHEQIYVANLAGYNVEEFTSIMEELQEIAAVGNEEGVRQALQQLTKTYVPEEVPVSLVAAVGE
ncbi:MAG: polysaccharide biosynthesis protein [Firmicutes bacterium]|nr:polysaccharide biosynthesis protein [Bacillota bacterium]